MGYAKEDPDRLVKCPIKVEPLVRLNAISPRG